MCHQRLAMLMVAIGVCFPCWGRLVAQDGQAENSRKSIFARLGPIHGHEYKCEDMVYVVNALKALGKEGALAALREFLMDSRFDYGREKSVFLVCRCLFDNPKGWSAPRLGVPQPELSDQEVRKLPRFPLMFSNGIPFLVIEGYVIEGRGEDPAECVKLCESLPLRKSDLPNSEFERAAQALIASDEFGRLFADEVTKKDVSRMVLEQAKSRRP